ncbi:IS110 family RNA-guided transposase [Mucilaginibacter ginkgonis]|uniref:IS110 family transposase n=1 Tax=Mucilaginibacter ginkgonis TaxID=2682091 RepID=A0A6I4HWA2_9SPHI|nr:IS110 family transposase [Mucilaginibacter ginkgonis]QQL50150.1 IS110 family transposase [Mucilaginibacter ginkgonis]
MKNLKYFIGIDISKNKLDLVILKDYALLKHEVIANTKQDIKDAIPRIKKLCGQPFSKMVFGFEHTGFYGNYLVDFLLKKRAQFVIENASQIRSSLGNIRGKNDIVDALRIAQYLYRNREHLKFWEPKRPIIDQLSALSTLRTRLITIQKALTTPIAEGTRFSNTTSAKQLKALCHSSIEAVSKEVKKINEEISILIVGDSKLNHLINIITSVPGVGVTTASQIIITTNEFKTIANGKKFACYAGVVPFLKSSGIVNGKARVSKMANHKMKSLLHLCALAAVRTKNSELNVYYKRKVAEGKNKLAVFNAVRNKIVLRIFACVTNDRLYSNSHQSISSGIRSLVRSSTNNVI